MFAAFMIVLTFVLVGGFIIQPLMMGKSTRPTGSDVSMDRLKLRKEVVYAQIKEAEMEFEMGNLSKGDFERSRTQLKEEASQIIGDIQKRRGK